MKQLKQIGKKIVPSAAMVAGGVVASKANNMLANTIKDNRLRAGAVVVAGILLGGMKGEMVKNIGAGMVTVGGMKLVAAVAPSLGIGDDVLNGLFDDVVADDTDNYMAGGVINGGDDMLTPGGSGY